MVLLFCFVCAIFIALTKAQGSLIPMPKGTMSFYEIDFKGFAQVLQLNRGLDSLSPVVMFGLASKKLRRTADGHFCFCSNTQNGANKMKEFDSSTSANQYMRVGAVASELGVSGPHVRNLIARGEISPVNRCGALLLIPRTTLEGYLRRSVVQPQAKVAA
jgi:excisionase family DNA binding protein